MDATEDKSGGVHMYQSASASVLSPSQLTNRRTGDTQHERKYHQLNSQPPSSPKGSARHHNNRQEQLQQLNSISLRGVASGLGLSRDILKTQQVADPKNAEKEHNLIKLEM